VAAEDVSAPSDPQPKDGRRVGRVLVRLRAPRPDRRTPQGPAGPTPVAGLAVTVFICHVGREVTVDVTPQAARRLDPQGHHRRRDRRHAGARGAACARPGVGPFAPLRVDVEGWIEPGTPPPAPVRSAAVADRLTYPEARSVTWIARDVGPTPGACTVARRAPCTEPRGEWIRAVRQRMTAAWSASISLSIDSHLPRAAPYSADVVVGG
jgi:hypothetical protein